MVFDFIQDTSFLETVSPVTSGKDKNSITKYLIYMTSKPNYCLVKGRDEEYTLFLAVFVVKQYYHSKITVSNLKRGGASILLW